MNRTLARAIVSPLVLIVSFTTAPLVCAQGTGAAEQPQVASSQTTPQEQPATQNQPPAQTAPPEQTPANHQPAVELPENPGRNNTTNEPANNTPTSTQAPQQQKQ